MYFKQTYHLQHQAVYLFLENSSNQSVWSSFIPFKIQCLPPPSSDCNKFFSVLNSCTHNFLFFFSSLKIDINWFDKFTKNKNENEENFIRKGNQTLWIPQPMSPSHWMLIIVIVHQKDGLLKLILLEYLILWFTRFPLKSEDMKSQMPN